MMHQYRSLLSASLTAIRRVLSESSNFTLSLRSFNNLGKEAWEKEFEKRANDLLKSRSYSALLSPIANHSEVVKKRIAKDPRAAYLYAMHMGERFPEGEAAIANDPYYSFGYANSVIKDRWPEGEAAIARNPKTAYEYAYHIVGGRWPEGEEAISRSPEYSNLYSRTVSWR